MRALGVILGILISILGGYAYFLDMELFLRLGWLLGALYILAGILLLLPTFREKKSKGEIKGDRTKMILGILSGGIGLVLLISGALKTLDESGLIYLVGACVMFFGILPIYAITRKPKEEPEDVPKKKKKKKPQPEPEKEDHRTLLVCGVISIILGALSMYSTHLSISVDRMIAYDIIMQGVNVVWITLDTFKKKEKGK